MSCLGPNDTAASLGREFLGLPSRREFLDLRAENARLRAALARIERWHGEFPETGKTWPVTGEPMSYGAAYGSNGERDYMRQVARDALRA